MGWLETAAGASGTSAGEITLSSDLTRMKFVTDAGTFDNGYIKIIGYY